MELMQNDFNEEIRELSTQLKDALNMEDELQKALKTHDSEKAKVCQATLLHLYRIFSYKIYHLLEQHLTDLDSLLETIKKMQSQLKSDDLSLISLEKNNRELYLDKIITEFSRYYEKTGQNSKSLWNLKEIK